MSIYRMLSGLIFDDSFETLDSRWLVSPSNSFTYSGEERQLTLEHNDTDRSSNALFEIPQGEDNILMQVQADYTPTHLGDEGGIVVWKNALEKVEFLESEDGNQTKEYSVWRAIKKQNLWTFFAERDNEWELFDSTISVDPTMLGVVLKGRPREGYVPLKIDRVILCRGSHISVGNVGSNSKVELLDANGTVVNTQIVPEGFSGVDLELPTIPFKGRIRVSDGEGETQHIIDEQPKSVKMYGGDMFFRGTDLTVIWQGKELSEVTPTNFGIIKQGKIEQKMTVLNNTVGNVAENVEVSIAVYLKDFGWEWCDLAIDVDGSPGEYVGTAIPMGTLLAGESKDFWITIAKVDSTDPVKLKHQMRPTHFYLEVRND